MPIVVAGAGIGDLTMALTLHQIGLPVRVYEAARVMRPLGVGIVLQPDALRELEDLGIGQSALDAIGVSIREWALVGLNGRDIHTEPGGRGAGFGRPQYAVHRGRLQTLLADTLRDRAGADTIVTGHQVTRYDPLSDGSVTVRFTRADARIVDERARLLIGADGPNSITRARMHPDQPPTRWRGAVIWRGVTRAAPIRSVARFVGIGTQRHRVILYPISQVGADGLADINWIAETTVDPSEGLRDDGWFNPVPKESFRHYFKDFRFDWLDVPALIDGAEAAHASPMIDRDPLPTRVDGPVALLGDAAHATDPTGSTGASQAIVDARVLGACLLEHGPVPDALAAYDARLREPVSRDVRPNRTAGPFALLDGTRQRCGGNLDDTGNALPQAARDAFVAQDREAAGIARNPRDDAPGIIPPGATVKT